VKCKYEAVDGTITYNMKPPWHGFRPHDHCEHPQALMFVLRDLCRLNFHPKVRATKRASTICTSLIWNSYLVTLHHPPPPPPAFLELRIHFASRLDVPIHS